MTTQARCETSGRLLRTLALKRGDKLRHRPGAPQTRKYGGPGCHAEDDEVDGLEIEIDDLCLEILAREQPVASDLRFITTAMKIVGDIERIGDNGVNIARRALEIMHEPELKPIIDVPVAAAAAQRILKESLDAFVNGDAEMAKRVIRGDGYIDAVCEQMLRELLTYMFEDPATISRALRLIFVSRNLERVGDHAANIAEMTIYLVEAHDVRHRQAAAKS